MKFIGFTSWWASCRTHLLANLVHHCVEEDVRHCVEEDVEPQLRIYVYSHGTLLSCKMTSTERDQNHQLFTFIVLSVWIYKIESSENNLDGNSSTDVTIL